MQNSDRNEGEKRWERLLDNGRDIEILQRERYGRWKKRLGWRDVGENAGGRREKSEKREAKPPPKVMNLIRGLDICGSDSWQPQER